MDKLVDSLDGRVNRLEEDVRGIGRELSDVKARTEVLSRLLESQSTMQQRIILGLLGLVAVLIGGKTVETFNDGGTPFMVHLQFLLTMTFFGMLSVRILMRAFDPRNDWRALTAGVLVAVAGYNRADLGFSTITSQTAWQVSLPLLAASLLMVWEILLHWIREKLPLFLPTTLLTAVVLSLLVMFLFPLALSTVAATTSLALFGVCFIISGALRHGWMRTTAGILFLVSAILRFWAGLDHNPEAARVGVMGVASVAVMILWAQAILRKEI